MAGKLTDLAIRKAQPKAKKYKLSGGNGLTLIVMPDGAKYWRLRYRYGGKEKELSLGRPYPHLTLKEAEIAAGDIRQLVADGVDPSEQRFQQNLDRRQKAAQHFGDAANAWYEFRSKAWAARTREQVREYLGK